MNNDVAESVWLQRIRRELDASTEALDAATLSRLNRARQKALAVRRHGWQRWVWPMAGVACAALLSVAVLPIRHGGEPAVDPLSVQTWEWLEEAPDADTVEGIRFLLELEGALAS